MTLTDGNLSNSLESFYKNYTEIVFRFIDRKALEKLAVLQNGILFCKTRLVERQTLRYVGGLEALQHQGH